ncbi:MAG: hypothetical protein QM737_02745 [Ferruginibacter sp.]
MSDELKKEIILQVDTGDSEKNVDNLKEKLNSVNNTQLDKPFKSFKAEIKEATNEAKKMEDQFGRNSKEFTEAAKRVADLRDRFGEFNQSIGAFNPDNKLQALVSVAKGATGAITGVTGAMQFLGVESGTATEAIARLQGLMAFSDALNSVDDIKNAFTNLGSVIQSSSAYQAVNNQLTVAASGIMKLFGVSVETTSKSFKVLKGAIAATGIGLLVVGISALIEHFDDLKEALGFTSKAQEAMNKTFEDFAKGAATARQKISEVKVGFDLAREGVISKKEALQKYNETLGDALGKVKTLDEAERMVAEKADAYIKATALKAQANALFALSAQETAKGLTASQEDQTGFLDKAKAYLANYVSYGAGVAVAVDAQQKGVEEAVNKANSTAELYQKKAEELLKNAAELGKDNKVNVNVLDVKDTSKEDEERRKRAAELLKKEREDLKKHLEDLQKIREDAERAKIGLTLNAREKELADIDNHYADQEKLVHKNEDEQVKILKDELKRKAITQQQYIDQFLAVQRAVGDTVLALQEEQGAKQLEVEKKYNKEIADFIDGYQDTAYQKSREKLIADFDEKIKVADDKQKELLEKLKDQQLGELYTNETNRKNTINAETNLVTVQTDNTAINEDLDGVKKDTPEEAVEKLQAIYDAEQAFRDAKFQEELAQLGSQEEEKALLRAKYDAANLNAAKQLSEARKAIDKAEVAAKKENIQNVSNLLGNLSALVGKQTAAGKAFAIAQTTIDTYQSAMQAYKSLSGIPYVGPILGGIAAASAIALGVAQIKKITSVQVPGGGGGGSAPTPTFTAPQIESTALNPDLNAVKDVRVTNQQDQPVKAYIVDRDLQDHQDKQQFYNNLGNV